MKEQNFPTLDEIGIDYNTDKSSMFVNRNGKSVKGHNYLKTYEYFLQSFRAKSFTLLELGVGPEHNCGRSLKTWCDYFPNAKIVGVDIREDARSLANERVTIEVIDSGNPEQLQTLGAKYKPEVIVDDASHLWQHQIVAFQHLYPQLQSGGIYIIEDIQTSFGKLRDSYSRSSSIDAYEYFLSLQTLIVGLRQDYPISFFRDAFLEYAFEKTEWVAALRESVIIKKA